MSEEKKTDVKTISADDVLFWRKSEEKLDQWNLIIKEYGLKINNVETVTTRISRNLEKPS
jgi:hypothetical protein